MTTATLERVCRLPLTQLSALDDTRTRLAGTATMYGHRVARGPGMALQIEAGAFTAAMRDPGRVKLLWQHDVAAIIGHLSRMWDEDDPARLQVEARINPSPAVPEARRFVANYEHGDIAELSVGFEWLKWELLEEQDDDGDRVTVVRVLKARLLEVSAVTFGAMGAAASVSEVLKPGGSRSVLAAEAARLRARMHAANH